MNRPKIISLVSVKQQATEWFWDGRIPFGKLTVLDADPGLGKTTLVMDLIARLTTAKAMPVTKNKVSAGAALILTQEDGLEDTIRGRLQAAGADETRVFAIAQDSDAVLQFPKDEAWLEETIREHGIRFVLLDPLTSFVETGLDINRDVDARRIMGSLARVAMATSCAILIIRHLNKNVGLAANYRGGGSVAVGAVARSVMLVSKHPDDPERRVLSSIKNNLAKFPTSIEFKVGSASNGHPRIEWGQESNHQADVLLNPPKESEREW